ncbi:unnamed protein product [Sympodiomycopsis kandeliae]
MSSSDAQTQLAQAIVAWLKDPSSSSASSNSSELQNAAESVTKAFNLDSLPPHSGPGLQTVYEVFLKTQAKMGGAAAPTTSSSSTAPSSSKAPAAAAAQNVPEPSAEDLKAADEHKTAGNKSMSAKDYGAAIAAYSKAIELNKSPIFYSNRAAAYSQIGQQDKAIEDAREAARIDPKFGKAYSRLGHALFSSGKYEEAAEAYQQGLLVDPGNKLMQNGLDSANAQVAKSKASGPSDTDSSPATRGAGAGAGAGAGGPGGFGGFPGMGGGGGGMPDLASLMNNPMMAQMAQNMMSNGGLEQLMQNPMLRGMAERMGQGGGGMPDMSQIQQLMQDPNIAQMARQFMGGAGGAGGGNNNSGNNNQGGAPGNMFG